MNDVSAGAHNDGVNQVFSIIGVQGTLGTADTGGTAKTLPISVDPATGACYVYNVTSLLEGNSSLTLEYNAEGNLGTITKIISGTSYKKTLSYTSGLLTGVSIWT